MNTREDMLRLEQKFKECQKALTAIGDETRQHILMIMLEGECSGHRVVNITNKTHLSRPGVSHHMQILKNAGQPLWTKHCLLHMTGKRHRRQSHYKNGGIGTWNY